MTNGQRGGLAIAFVAVIGVVLIRPVITADDTEPVGAPEPVETEEPEPEPTEEPEPTPTEDPEPAPTETPEPEVALPVELSADVPDECFVAQPLPADQGQIAAVTDDGVTIASPTGEVLAEIDASGPVGYSPSGKLLATEDGTIYNSDGREREGFSGLSRWAWSPQSDCIFGILERDLPTEGDVPVPSGALIAGSPGLDRIPMGVMTTGPIADFAVSATRLAVVGPDGALGFYNLRTGQLIGQPTALVSEWALLLGWRGPSLLYATHLGNGRIALNSIKAGARSSERIAVVGAELAALCGERLIGVNPSGRLFDIDTGTLLGDAAFRYGTPGCAPGGSFIAVPRVPRSDAGAPAQMVILDPDGGFIQDAGPGGPGDEIAPEWSPSGSQLLFLKLSGSTRAELMYAQAGGGGETGIQVSPSTGAPIDWSATAPIGHPWREIF